MNLLTRVKVAIAAIAIAASSIIASPAAAATGAFIVPATGVVYGQVGPYCDGTPGSSHAGIDISRSAGGPIYAARGGTVTASGSSGNSLGQIIRIDHGAGWVSTYAHLASGSLAVAVGQQVSQGQQIASMGATGGNYATHLHWELRLNGSAFTNLNSYFTCFKSVTAGTAIPIDFPGIGAVAEFRGSGGFVWAGNTDIPIVGDWNGDGLDDTGVTRANYFYKGLDGANYQTAVFGNGLSGGDVPITGDWNGDGTTDIGVQRRGQFILTIDGSTVYKTISFGNGAASNDIPITGDWNGDGTTDVGINRGRDFLLSLDGTVYRSFALGDGISAGDAPITGDWNADGTTDIGIVRGREFILSLGSGVLSSITFGNGIGAGDIPIIGDWNGDGRSDVGVVRNSTFIEAAPTTSGGAAVASQYTYGNGSRARL